MNHCWMSIGSLAVLLAGVTAYGQAAHEGSEAVIADVWGEPVILSREGCGTVTVLSNAFVDVRFSTNAPSHDESEPSAHARGQAHGTPDQAVEGPPDDDTTPSQEG